jgi:hypothetical protein
VAISLTTFIQTAQLRATQAGTTAKAVIEAILVGQFQSSVSNGRTIIQTAEAGGSVQLAIPDGLSPAEVTELAGRALPWIEARPDPNNPGLPREVRRLRVTFGRARI